MRIVSDTSPDSLQLRRSGAGNIGKAKIQTIKMTFVIIITFIVCWTPYYVISLWYWFFKLSASQLDLRVQRILLTFAVSNSCFNPIVYGYFSVKSSLLMVIRQSICCCCCLLGKRDDAWKLDKNEHSRTRQTCIRTTLNSDVSAQTSCTCSKQLVCVSQL